jgi:hypothetical protein
MFRCIRYPCQSSTGRNRNITPAEVLKEQNRALTKALRRQGVTGGMLDLADFSIPGAVTNFETISNRIFKENRIVEGRFKSWALHVESSGGACQSSECINLLVGRCPESDSVLVWLMMLGFCDGKIFGNGIPIMVFEFKPAFGAVIPGETKSWE